MRALAAKSAIAMPASRALTRKGGRRPANIAETREHHKRSFDLRRRMRVWRRNALIALLAAIAGWLYWAESTHRFEAWGDALNDRFQRAVVAAGLTVDNVRVEGIAQTSRPQLLTALNVHRGQSMMDVDLDAAKERIEEIGWVKKATVVRRFPHDIVVVLEERQPFALWQYQHKMMLVDDTGLVITDRGLNRYGQLPMVVGAGAPRAAGELMAMLRTHPELAGRMAVAVRVGDRRWDIVFTGGLRAMLPAQGQNRAWDKLAALNAEKSLFERDIEAVDLRQADKIVLRMTPQAAEQRRKPAHDEGRVT